MRATGGPRVHLAATDARLRAEVSDGLLAIGACLVDPPVAADLARARDIVVLVAAPTIDEAAALAQAVGWRAPQPLMAVARRFPLPGVLRALRAGMRAMVRAAEPPAGGRPPERLAPGLLSAALEAARRRETWLPQDVLVRVLGHEGSAAGRGADTELRHTIAPSLTARQTAVLALVADGYGNAAIARELACSEHTVKNTVYDLTARLHVRNRAHAVARAVRAGLV